MAEVAGFLSAIFGAGISIVNELKKRGGIADTGIIIDYSRREIECQISINLGEKLSRASGIGKKISAFLTQKMTIEDVTRVSGFGFITNENLEELGIIKISNRKAEIDFPSMIKNVQASTVMIKIRKPVALEIINGLIEIKVGKVPTRSENAIESPAEIVLNHGDLWYSRFGSFSVRNISFEMNLSVHRDVLKKAVPEDLRQKLIQADSEASTNDEAKKYLFAFERVIMQFQDQEFITDLMNAVSVSEPRSMRLVTIIPQMQGYRLSKSSLRTMLPGRLRFVFEAEIEDKEKAIHESIRLDIKQYQNSIKNLVEKFRDEANKINF